MFKISFERPIHPDRHNMELALMPPTPSTVLLHLLPHMAASQAFGTTQRTG